MTVLHVRGLHVRAADGSALLTAVDLSVEAGERVLVVGASGSGKSTLLRVLAGLEPAPGARISGSVRVAGRELVGRDPDDDPLDVGWLPQDPAAAVCLPVVADDVAFGCENRGMPVAAIDSAVAAALAATSAVGLRGRVSATLSSGQAQRVGLAAGLAPRPALLLLDEPTSMLDPVSLRALRRAVMTPDGDPPDPPHHAPAAAVLLVEHRLDEWEDAGGLPDRVIALDSGRVVADGPAAQVWAQYGESLATAGCHLPWSLARTQAPPPPQHPLPPAEVVTSTDTHDLGTEEVLLRAEDLAVGRTRSAVLAGLDLELRAGEVVAVVGPNGIGKSTLLLTLAGLLRPLGGSVTHPGGRPALVFARPEQQFLAATVRAELSHDGAGAAAVTAMLQALRLEHAADRSVHRLSGGEQRRLSVGTVLLGRRRLLLADEPTFGLDRHGVRWTTSAIRSAAREGRGVLVSSHDLRFVADVADRVIVLADGGMHSAGPVAEVLGDLARVGVPLPSDVGEQVGAR